MSVNNVVTKAHKAFAESQDHSYAERAGWLEEIAAQLEAHRESLVAVAKQETHLPEARLNAELMRTSFQLRFLAAEVRRGEFLDPTIDREDAEWRMGRRPDIRSFCVPRGVTGVFGASNFPFAFSVAGGDSAAALAAGCSVVHKVHQGHTSLGETTLEVVIDALSASGAPDGIFSTVTGREAGISLVEHPLVKAVAFTGSTVGGRALFDRAAARPEPIPFYGELGSINPVVVTEMAWHKRSGDIARGFIESMTAGNGQFCTKPGLLFVPSSLADEVFSIISDGLAITELSAKMLNDRIWEGFVEARNAVGSCSEILAATPSNDANPPKPSVFRAHAGDLENHSALLTTEMFGPAAVIVSYSDQTELISTLSDLHGQLTGTFHAEEGEAVGPLVRVLTERCGRVIKNEWPTGVTVSYAQNHGGPYPAATADVTSVGSAAIGRFLRPVAYQNFSDAELPAALQDGNPLGLSQRRVNGHWHQ